MATPNTNVNLTLTADFLRQLGIQGDPTQKATPGVWVDAIWYGNNATTSGLLNILNGNAQTAAANTAFTYSSTTGLKGLITNFSNVLSGGTMYIVAGSNANATTDPFVQSGNTPLPEGQINNIANALRQNYTFGLFELTLKGGDSDEGDLSAIPNFGFPMSATTSLTPFGSAINTVGYKASAPGSVTWTQLGALASGNEQLVYSYNTTPFNPSISLSVTGPAGTYSNVTVSENGQTWNLPTFSITGSSPSQVTAVAANFNTPAVAADTIWTSTTSGLYFTNSAGSVLGQANGPIVGNSFAITPASATGSASTLSHLPFSADDWNAYLSYLTTYQNPANPSIIGEITGIFNGAPSVLPTNANNVSVWHNSAFYDYQLSYHQNLYVNGSTPENAFVLSPTANSQVKGYIVITQNDLANSIYATLGSAKVFENNPTSFTAQNPGVPFAFAAGTPSNPSTASSFNVGANNQWGTVFTQLITGLSAGYIGSVGNNHLNTHDANFQVNLSNNWNWDPSFAFGNNTTTNPGAITYFDKYAQYFFDNSNVYGNMYSDNLMLKYLSGGPLISLSGNSGSNIPNINLTVFGNNESPTGYTTPVINNTIHSGLNLKAPNNATLQTLDLVFTNNAGATGGTSFVADPQKLQISVRAFDGSSHWSTWVNLATPSVQVNLEGLASQSSFGVINQGTTMTDQYGNVLQIQTSVPMPGSATGYGHTQQLPATQIKQGTHTPDASSIWSLEPLQVIPFNVSGGSSQPGANGMLINGVSDIIQGPGNTLTATVHIQGGAGTTLYGSNAPSGACSVLFEDTLGNIYTFTGSQSIPTSGPNAGNVTFNVTAQNTKGMPSGATLSMYETPAIAAITPLATPSLWNTFNLTYQADGSLTSSALNTPNMTAGNVYINTPTADSGQSLYQIQVANSSTGEQKVFNLFTVHSGLDAIDGGAYIVPGKNADSSVNYASQNINLTGKGPQAFMPSLNILNANNGGYALWGQPYAAVIGSATPTTYDFLGTTANISALPNQSNLTSNNMTISSNQASGLVFGWSGFNPLSEATPSPTVAAPIQTYTNKVSALDVVQINIVDVTNPNNSQTIFAQADLDGQWLTGKGSITVNGHILNSNQITLNPGETYKISFQEYSPQDPGLAAANGKNAISQPSQILQVSVGAGLSSSAAVNAANSSVYEAYGAILNRLPDAAGFSYWVDQIAEQKISVQNLASVFQASAEGQDFWSEIVDNTTSLANFYHLILNRSPDQAGLAYWQNALDSGALTTAQVADLIFNSAEHTALVGNLTEQTNAYQLV